MRFWGNSQRTLECEFARLTPQTKTIPCQPFICSFSSYSLASGVSSFVCLNLVLLEIIFPLKT